MFSNSKSLRVALVALLAAGLLAGGLALAKKPENPGKPKPDPEPPPPPVTYKITWLGTLGGPTSRLMDMNDFGDVVGSSYTSEGERHGFLNEAQPDGSRTMTDLNTLIPDDSAFAGWSIRQANAINNQGQIAGFARLSDGSIVYYRYTPGADEPLEDLGTNDGRINDMNNDGTIVGGQGGYAFRYTYGTGIGMEFLDDLIDPASEWLLSRPEAINDLGWIVGLGYLEGDLSSGRGFLFIPAAEGESYATVVDLGECAHDISDVGDVVGDLETNRGLHAFLYTPLAGLMDLGAFDGKSQSRGWGVNDLGQVVGFGNRWKDPRAYLFLALPPTYELLNVDDLIDPVANDPVSLNRWYASGVHGSQESTRITTPLLGGGFGQIGGASSLDSNDLEAYILTPVPPEE